ncbi:hypothetical protein AJ79_05599 [Helicocarpus griseus UAMH5409]|uniref:Glucose-repressible alcohol dehydrogenase transcriptional effector n=1 Tax=Helicocarpus griseus UAMH5409 TaxID=1447875 RepID=A0A2B7XMJ4_9EURO|nr:hypothetical protein AJ79_05599 [Helicocarpus griseus UAMH5409]
MNPDIPLPPPPTAPFPPRRRSSRNPLLPPRFPHHLSHHSNNNDSYYNFDSSLPSSDPPLFSSDDFQSSALENYHNDADRSQLNEATTRPDSRNGGGGGGEVLKGETTRKRQYRGTWWGQEKGEERCAAEKKRRTEFRDKRNWDSGVWLGSDDSVSVVEEGAGLAGYAGGIAAAAAATTTAGGGEGGERQVGLVAGGPLFARRRVDDGNNVNNVRGVVVEEESPQHKEARRIVTECLENGNEVIDISHLDMSTIPPGLLRPIAQFTKYPTGQFFASFEPFLRLFMTNNRLKALPAEVFDLSNLTVLSVRHNELEEIPGSIGNLKKLRELNLAGNQLSHLPFEILQLLQAQDTEMKQLTVHPNPFVMPDDSSVAQWHCLVREDGTFVEKEDEMELNLAETADPLSVIMEQAGATNPKPIPVATGIVQFFDADGRPISTPATSPSLSRHTPTLRELALRAYNRGPQISQHIDPEVLAAPPLILELLRRAERVRDAGGMRCSVCARSFVIARARWVEWWDCTGFANVHGRHGNSRLNRVEVQGTTGVAKLMVGGRVLTPLPFLREVCCWGCVGGFGKGNA